MDSTGWRSVAIGLRETSGPTICYYGAIADGAILIRDGETVIGGNTSSPTFATVKLTNLTDGRIPYHVSDAVGLADGPFSWDGTGDVNTVLAAEKTLVLNQPVYNDIWQTAAVDRSSGTNYLTFVGNCREFVFGVNDNVDLPSIEIGHDLKEGTPLAVHVHWATRGTNAGATGVKWQVEYTIADKGAVFPATVTISAEDTVPGGTAEFMHRFLAVGTIVTTGLHIGAQLKMLVSRIAASGAAPSLGPYFLQLGIHYQVDTMGSRQPTVK